MLYESKQAKISDQLTRIKSVEEKGENDKGARVAENLLRMGLNVEQVSSAAEISIEKVKQMSHKFLISTTECNECALIIISYYISVDIK